MSNDVHVGKWRAMGSSVEVVVVGCRPELLDVAKSSIDHHERHWSRFLPDSDISRLNHAAGSTVHIDPATVVLLRAMIDGWRATTGAFDPTLLAPLVGLGYAASWDVYPFNSGYFMCVKVKGVDAEKLRVHLLDAHQTGLIATSPVDIRVAFSCLELDQIEPLFACIAQAIGDLI